MTTRLFVTAGELGEHTGQSAEAVKHMVRTNGLPHSRGSRDQMVFSRTQIVDVLAFRGVPETDAVELAAHLTGMAKPKPTKPKTKAAPVPDPVTTSPATDSPLMQPIPDPFRTTARSRASHRRSA